MFLRVKSAYINQATSMSKRTKKKKKNEIVVIEVVITCINVFE